MTEAADILSIDKRRRQMKLPATSLCSAAGVGRRTYSYAINGETTLYPATLAKLNAALNRFRIGFGGEATALAPHAAFKACIVLAALWMNADAKSALASAPARRATSNPEWQKAAEVRQLGYWIANGFLGFRTSDIGRAAGVTKQAVSNAIRELEDEREQRPELDQLCRRIEEIFE